MVIPKKTTKNSIIYLKKYFFMKSNLVIEFRLRTKSHPLIPIEKPFSIETWA